MFWRRGIPIWGVLLCLALGQGCALRRVAPFRYLPGLGQKANDSMAGILGVALKDKNPMVRREAVRLVGTMIATPAQQRLSAEALGRALKDKEVDIRLEAVKALGNIPIAISGPYLRRAMKDRSVQVRIQVVQVLREAYQRETGQAAGTPGVAAGTGAAAGTGPATGTAPTGP